MEQSKLLFFLYLPLLFLNACSSGTTSDYYSTEDYGKMQKIDAHFHVDTYDSSILNNSIENNSRLLSLNDEDWEEKTLEYLRNSFDKGAVAVKVLKNIGIELVDKEWFPVSQRIMFKNNSNNNNTYEIDIKDSTNHNYTYWHVKL